MGKIEETRESLKALGISKAKQADICFYVLLAMAAVKSNMLWSEVTNDWIRIHNIIQFSNTYSITTYAENSRETFRKQALHMFRTAALVEENRTATNSPNYRDRLTKEAIQIIRMFRILKWHMERKQFLKYYEKIRLHSGS